MATNTETHNQVLSDEEQKTFSGATLQIDGVDNQTGHEPGVDFVGSGTNFNRNRPGSVYGRQSIRSTTSRTSVRPGFIKSDVESDTFFSYKEENFNRALETCKKTLKADIDGDFVGAWLLTCIDHWDNERERLLILTKNCMLIYKYDFIIHKMEDFKRVMLHLIDTICVGDFVYPPKSLMPPRQHGGIQVRWNKGEQPTWAQVWNPWCASIPWINLSHHPLLYNPKEYETAIYNVDEFYESLIQAISNSYKEKRPDAKITIVEGPIFIESYASLSSMIYNQSGLGFNRDRKGISF